MSRESELQFPDGALRESMAEAGLAARCRSADVGAWRDASARVGYLPVDYSAALIEYQSSYWSGNGTPLEDLSLTLLHDGRACALWPLCGTLGANGMWRLGSNGGPILPPLFVADLPRKSVKAMTAKCLALVHAICRMLGQAGFDSVELYSGTLGLSDWHDRMLLGGASVELRHDLFLDLSRSLPEIKGSFRKSYKSLVSAGTKLWGVQIIRNAAAETWEEFRSLHQAVAGRITRSAESWRLQHAAIATGDAFFVSLRDRTSRMVGGGLFHVTPHESVYAVAAYDRMLFDKPLGHVVQFHAIEEMKSRGVRWYKIGARPYPGDVPAPNPKDMSIANFKQGFASHIFPRYLVKNEQEII